MKKAVILIALIFIFQLLTTAAQAQQSNTTQVQFNLSIPPIALIRFAVEDSQVIMHSYPIASNQAKQTITTTHMPQTWLNYSSIVRPGSRNYITANISSGFLPSDVSLHVFVSPDAGAGGGALGTPVGEITLTHYPQNLIIDIGSCYTGAGVKKGRLIHYIWDNPESYDYFLRYQHGEPIAVTYTITSH